jgi:hypothetical protein
VAPLSYFQLIVTVDASISDWHLRRREAVEVRDGVPCERCGEEVKAVCVSKPSGTIDPKSAPYWAGYDRQVN